MTIFNSTGIDLAKQNQPRFKISPLRATTNSQSKIYPKSVHSRPQYPLEVKVVQNQSFQHTTSSQNENYPKSVLSSPPHPPKVKIVRGQSFQVQKTLLKLKESKISNYNTTTHSQSRNGHKSVLF